MPKTLQYRPTLIDNLVSLHRMGSYHAVFKTTTDLELMGAYLWNSHACGAIYPIIGAAEIALRNAIDGALLPHLGTFWWGHTKLHYKNFVRGGPVPDSVEKVRNNFTKATSAFKKDRFQRYQIPTTAAPVHHGVVAKTEFSTWEFLLDSEFMGNNLIWPSRLGAVFAGPWPQGYTPGQLLPHAKDLVKTVREFRNRLFHYEPAWKKFGVQNEVDALAHLNEKINKIEALVHLIHPEKHRLLERNGLLRTARRACSGSEIRRFQHIAQTHKVNSLNRLRDLVDRCGRENETVIVKVMLGTQRTFQITPHR